MANENPTPKHNGFKDRTGEKHGRWTVLAYHSSNNGARWLCRCECGTEKVIKLSARSLSCGCLHREIVSEVGKRKRGLKHQNKREHAAWNQMLQRCHNPNNPTYARYGAKGIHACDRWRESFANFLEDMGPCQSPTDTIDRIDNNKGYEPSNCRWLPKHLQSRNRRLVELYDFQGERLTIREIAERVGIKTPTLRARLKIHKWPLERAISQNPDDYHRKGA